ncbi:MAG: TonB-dependent receptor [Prevotellaceae bacterium]|nr:TonB-dependent receptor [Prevotellaceae bacterium]
MFLLLTLLQGISAGAAAIAQGQSHHADEDTLKNVQLEEVAVVGQQKGTSISRVNPILTEKISSAGLKKLACCNLAESFENSASVTVGFSDAVSGTRQIRMLGLAGIYTQMLDESRPAMRGLGATYGLAYTPGAWLEGIQISKGTSSVASGYEGITGQINQEFRKPENPDPLFVNAYFNSDLRGELNLASSFEVNPHLSGVALLHVSGDPQQVDVNGDGFADQPQTRQINAASRWLYLFENGAVLHSGVRFLVEDRQGGQVHFDRERDRGDSAKYGSYIVNRSFNAYAKLGLPFGSEGHSSTAIVADYTLHDQRSFFGPKVYNGTEHSLYLNGLLKLELSERHHATFGLGLRGDVYREEYGDGWNPASAGLAAPYLLHENEYVGGLFGEYTFTLDAKLTAIAGLRVDQNNLYGTLLTPRAHLKYSITESLVARASAGRGLHSPNVITDNVWVMASRRELVATEKPKMEDAWTFGLSLTKYIQLDHAEKASVSADVFHTEFTNQLIVDQEVGGNRIAVYNLSGRSYANSYQLDVIFEPVLRFNVFATFRYSDTKVALREMGFVRKPLIDNFKGLLNLSYATKFNRWMFDVTAQINGQSRLPDSRYVAYDDPARDYQDGYSPVYPLFLAQVTKRFRHFDVYVGCENIANYMQENPVISAADPNSSRFNAGVIWGPLMGRKLYVGMRWSLQ